MRLNVVFNLESVKELQELTKALTQTSNMLQEAALTQRIDELKFEKSRLEADISELKTVKAAFTSKGDKKGEVVSEAKLEEESSVPRPVFSATESRRERSLRGL